MSMCSCALPTTVIDQYCLLGIFINNISYPYFVLGWYILIYLKIKNHSLDTFATI